MTAAEQWSRKEVNTRALKSAVLYLKRQLGQEATERLCEETGLSYQYLIDENNWVSLAWLNRLYQKMVETTGNPNSPYESGLLAADPEVWGSIYFFFRAVGTPALAYKQLQQLSPSFNKRSRFELVRLERNRAELRWYSTGEHPFVCDNRRGQLASAPTFWGLPPAEIEEDECSARGGRYCRYRISWVRRSRILPAVALGILIGGAAWIVGGAGGIRPPWLMGLVCGLAGYLGARVSDLLRTERDNAEFNEAQNDKLRASMQELEKKYDEVRDASREIEDLNVNLERKVQERTAALQNAQAELAASFKKLQELDRLKSNFFSNVTHELRTPLTMILAPLESLIDETHAVLPAAQREYLLAIRGNALRLLKLINDLLDLVRLEEKYLRLRVERVEVAAFLEEIVEHTRPLATRKGVSVGLELEPGRGEVYADPEKLERAIVNLLANALKFTDPGGSVTVWSREEPDAIKIGVRDNGPGIPPDQQRWIFERFRQADDSVTRRYGGTGIGLALAKEIVELHGGALTVNSEVGRGSEFVIGLRRGSEHFRAEALDRRQRPVAATETRRSDDREPREWTRLLLERKDYRFLDIEHATERRVAPRGDEQPRATKILVVEDNLEILRFLSLQLRDVHSVYLAQDGQRGLALARAERPDIIISDYMMPGMDGLELLRQLRAEATTTGIPVIMLTAKNDVADRLAAREAGADIYLSKPFSPQEVKAAVDQLLAKQGRQAAVVVREQVKSLEVISAGLAHEIHNPLSYVANAVHVIGEKVADIELAAKRPETSLAELRAVIEASREKTERMLHVAKTGTERIRRMVELVHNYARAGYPRELVSVSLDDMVREVAPLILRPENRHVDIECELGAPGVLVKCVPAEMEQVIRNLWQNALEAVGNGGRVSTRTRADGSFVFLEVIDDGPGIAREVLPRIFTPFFTTKEPGKGLGLGLAITHQLVSSFGGEIAVESAVDQGTTFRVRLPIHSPRALDREPAAT